MPINFHDKTNKQSYTTRNADISWIKLIKRIIDFKKVKRAADIGCGGGIYSLALAEMGLPSVTGVDFSGAMLEGASINCEGYEQIHFKIGNALETGLSGEEFELVLERALIHHLKDLNSCFKEAYRLLKPGGTVIIQDRTPEDCLLRGTTNHIRGYILAAFPHLAEFEINRRHSSEYVIQELKAARFKGIEEIKLWETRNVYPSKEDLLRDIGSRTGRSILHELSDQELNHLLHVLDQRLDDAKIIEKDCWTIWKASKQIV